MNIVKRAVRKTKIYIAEQRKSLFYGNKHFCISCKHSFFAFKPYQNVPESPLFKNGLVIGAGFRENYECPYCGTLDRERWQQYVITKHTDILTKKNRILHFAAENNLYKLFKHTKTIDYYPCDIDPRADWLKVDMTDIPFDDDTFDWVISNHVLEHIPDEKKAISAIRRILKPQGSWIFSFPIRRDADTHENEAITDPQERIRLFGQKDHVRLYGKDFKERFERYGLKLEIHRPIDELDAEEIEKNGLIPDDTIIIARFE